MKYSQYVPECLAVKEVCEKYGYGNVMEWASALWRYSEQIPSTACFVPTCPEFIKKKYQNQDEHAFYDKLVEDILGEKEKNK